MKINVKHIAQLANLPLTDAEEKKFEEQLTAVLEYIEKLSELDVQTTEETSQITGLIDIERTDSMKPSLSQEEATNQAHKNHNGLFVVPVILEEAVE